MKHTKYIIGALVWLFCMSVSLNFYAQETTIPEASLVVKYYKTGNWVNDNRIFADEITAQQVEGISYFKVYYDQDQNIVKYEKYNELGEKIYSISKLTVIILSALNTEEVKELPVIPASNQTNQTATEENTEENVSTEAVGQFITEGQEKNLKVRFFKTLGFITSNTLDEITPNQACDQKQFYVVYYNEEGHIKEYQYYDVNASLDLTVKNYMQQDTDVDELSYYKLYNYSSSGKLNSEQYKSADGELLFQVKYTYNEKGKLIKSESYNQNDKRIFYFQYQLDNYGKVKEMQFFREDSLVSSETYLYEDNGRIREINVFNSIGQLIKKIEYNEFQRVARKHVYEVNATGKSELSYYWVYTYNADKDLVKQEKFNPQGQSLEVIHY